MAGMVDQLAEWAGSWAALLFVALFLAGSLVIIWRLNCMSARGVEGTVLGTLVMPYASGIGNLIFAFLMASRGGPGEEVVVNCLVNNVTNLTLLLGLPAAVFGMAILPNGKRMKKREAREGQLNRISLLLTLLAGGFFAGIMWALGRDGKLTLEDGLVLVGVFLFWQIFHVYEVLKQNVATGQRMSPLLFLDLGLIVLGGLVLYYSTDWIVTALMEADSGFLRSEHIGWITGWLMVLPNALMAFYFAWRGRADILASSQIGDGHICIPLCIGVYCIFQTSGVPEVFDQAVLILAGALALHFVFIATIGRLPRIAGGLLVAAYGWFVWAGVV